MIDFIKCVGKIHPISKNRVPPFTFYDQFGDDIKIIQLVPAMQAYLLLHLITFKIASWSIMMISGKIKVNHHRLIQWARSVDENSFLYIWCHMSSVGWVRPSLCHVSNHSPHGFLEGRFVPFTSLSAHKGNQEKKKSLLLIEI